MEEQKAAVKILIILPKAENRFAPMGTFLRVVRGKRDRPLFGSLLRCEIANFRTPSPFSNYRLNLTHHEPARAKLFDHVGVCAIVCHLQVSGWRLRCHLQVSGWRLRKNERAKFRQMPKIRTFSELRIQRDSFQGVSSGADHHPGGSGLLLSETQRVMEHIFPNTLGCRTLCPGRACIKLYVTRRPE
jgi:hypothetical protein